MARRSGCVRTGCVVFWHVKARRSWIGSVCQGWSGRGGRGEVRCVCGLICYGVAVKAWLGLVRCVMVCRGGQGKACWVELGHGGARRSRLGLFRYGRIWLGMMGRGGRGAVR